MNVPSSRLLSADLGRLAINGVRTRPLRAALSALGIAIGVAAIVAVLGISRSAQADLLHRLDELGTNLLRAEATQGLGFGAAVLPETAVDAASRITPVQSVASTAAVEATVLRSDRSDTRETGGLSVHAADPELLDVLDASVAKGTFLTEAIGRYATVVLGAVAAERLGIDSVDEGVTVWIGGHRFLVVGILDEVPLAGEIDRAALVGYEVAESLLGLSGEPSTLYLRSAEAYVEDVRAVLPAQVNPQHPDTVSVSRPSDALAAKAATEDALTGLLVGLGAVSLLVGAVGVANVMVMGVLERRSEIGLRRALGATRAHVRRQFLVESMVLAGMGGVAGVALGGLVTFGYAVYREQPTVVPIEAIAGGTGVALVLGAVAGLYPAVRAARLAPVDALRTA